jgi:hypothetical protein
MLEMFVSFFFSNSRARMFLPENASMSGVDLGYLRHFETRKPIHYFRLFWALRGLKEITDSDISTIPREEKTRLKRRLRFGAYNS